MITSTQLKIEALAWLRFGKQMDLVCTEGGYWNSDVIGICENFSVEVEVKVSISDLQAEFRNKQTKHLYYQKMTSNVPNYFYFLVPEELSEKAIEIIKDKMPKAGVVAYYEKYWQGKPLRVVKKAAKLHKEKPVPTFKQSVLKRMGSELVCLHIALGKLKSVKIETVSEIQKQVAEIITKVMATQDLENPDGEGNDGDTSSPSSSGNNTVVSDNGNSSVCDSEKDK